MESIFDILESLPHDPDEASKAQMTIQTENYRLALVEAQSQLALMREALEWIAEDHKFESRVTAKTGHSCRDKARQALARCDEIEGES